MDYGFLFVVVVLCLFGALMAYSASSVYAAQYHDDSAYYIKRHILYLVLGTALTFPFVWKARPWFWRFFGVASYALSVVLLLLVLIIGSSYGSGATRWIQLGPISIQPSEIAKMAVVLCIALIMSKYEKQIAARQRFGGQFVYGVLYPMIVFGFICVLVMLEHHLSGIIIIGLMGLVTMYIGGTDKKWFFYLFALGATAVVFVLLVSDYAMLRVTTWINIENVDPLGSAWQTLQGLNAIGSGGIFGRGLGNSQQKYGYVSQPQNDFIFTIVCEELGFIGALAVILLFGCLIWRGFRIASKAPDKFTSIVVYGLICKVALQAILNIAVVTNTAPNTGIALPFFSSGGTSLILQIFEMGIILSISRYSYQKR
ncbi:MAG: cell division protein FtsW [Ruminococcaceae bacterium]|nr:cell division protein FtsW [Oscillospiraceae bacterium]